jgi:hypothetical protein
MLEPAACGPRLPVSSRSPTPPSLHPRVGWRCGRWYLGLGCPTATSRNCWPSVVSRSTMSASAAGCSGPCRCWSTRPAVPPPDREPLVRGRDLREGGWPLTLRLRAIDQFGRVIDVLVSPRRDAKAASRFFERAIGTTKVEPVEVVTHQAATYPIGLEALLPAAWHRPSSMPTTGLRPTMVGCPASGDRGKPTMPQLRVSRSEPSNSTTPNLRNGVPTMRRA